MKPSQIKGKILKLLALTMVFALFLGVLAPFAPEAQAQGTPYFIVANDTVLPLQPATTPDWVGGQLSVPYTVFQQQVSGVDLGILCAYKPEMNLLTLYARGTVLVFDLEAGNSTDQMGEINFPYKATVRNGVPFVPVAGVCDYFGLQHTYYNTAHGYLLRIKSNSAVLSDSRFLDAADNLLGTMAKDYGKVDEPSPSPTTSTTPNQSEEETPEESLTETPLCLGIVATEEAQDFTPLLEEKGIYAVFFFTPDQLEDQGDFLRKILSQGHFIGLISGGETLEDHLLQIKKGQQYLRQQTLSSTTIVMAPEAFAGDLEDRGFIWWQGGGGKESAPDTLVKNLSQGTATTYLTLAQSELNLQQWNSLTKALEEEHFVFLVPTEFEL